MKKISITKGLFVLVDKGDYFLFCHLKFNATKCGRLLYAQTRINGKNKYLHRIITNAAPGQIVDHKNMNTLDCRKDNLRICNKAENNNNKPGRSNSTSIYKGVSYSKDRRKWCAHISHNGKSIYIGRFDKETDAAKAYNKEAVIYFKEYAWVNKID